MNWLILAFALQLGYTPNSTILMYDPPSMIYDTTAQGLVSMDAEARILEHLYIGGSLSVPVWKTPGIGFWPSELQSMVRAGLRFPGFELGWSHLCTHPVLPYQPIFNSQVLWEGAYDEFHLRISGEVKL
jgi:hypothetical protein